MGNKVLEARIGVEPTNKGFADLCLTTWLPRPGLNLPELNKVGYFLDTTSAAAARVV